MNKLSYILPYVEAAEAKGWRTFKAGPNPDKPGKLKPYLTNWNKRDDLPFYTTWANENAAYAIHCGKSGLLVVDIDEGNGKTGENSWQALLARNDATEPETYTVRSAHGGRHLYFENALTPFRDSEGELAKNIDIRGDGGCVFGAGSWNGDLRYEVIKDVPVSPLPWWLLTELRDIEYRKIDASWYRKSLDELLAEVASSDKGSRNATLNTAAFVAFSNTRFPEDAEEVEAMFRDAASTCGLPGSEADSTLASARSSGTARKAERIAQDQGHASQTHQEPSDDLELVPMSSIKMKRTDWFWDTGLPKTLRTGQEGRIPLGTLSIVVGRPGAGKGQYACWLAAQVTKGLLPGALQGTPKGVIFYSTEDDYARTIAPRLFAAGADIEKVFFPGKVDREDNGKFVTMKLSKHLPRLKQLIQKHDIGLVILDPLLSAMSKTSDPNNDQSVRSEIEPLQMALTEIGCTGVGITHFRKMHDDDILNMISGSGAFARVIRSAVALGEEKDEGGEVTRVLSTVKNSYGRTDIPSFIYTFAEVKVDTDDGATWVSRFVMGNETDESVEDMHSRKATVRTMTKTELATTWLEEKLRNGPVLKDDLMKMHADERVMCSWATVEKAAAFIVSSEKEFQGKATWQLKF